MKSLILVVLSLAISSTSHAVVADKFKCSLEIKDLVSKISSKQDKEFFVARIPLSSSPHPEVRLTAGQITETLTLDTPNAQLDANLNFYYKHAVKSDANGVLDARQSSCVALVGSYCEKSGGGPRACKSPSVTCFEAFDPFDPTNGWAKTGIVGGTPTFNEQILGPVTANLFNDNGNPVGIINLKCQYSGSFE